MKGFSVHIFTFLMKLVTYKLKKKLVLQSVFFLLLNLSHFVEYIVLIFGRFS